MANVMIGASAHQNADVALMRQAGIGWVRHGFPLPFTDRLYGEVSDHYRKAKAEAEAWVAAGIEVMGVSPGPGHGTFEPDTAGGLKMVWRSSLPEWFGAPGSAQFLRSYEAVCAWLARDLQGIVSAWQIANELEIRQFAGPLDLRQACDLILAGARGLKAADPSLFVGPNSGGTGEAYYLYGRLYADPGALLDYCGVDQYYGTWQPGGPELWAERVAELHALTGKPIVVNEWGFSSAGELMSGEERRMGVPNCQLRKWQHGWGPGHTPEGQAEFVRKAFAAFASQREALAGVLFYRWEDQERCWQCGSPDCPVETRWGLVDLEGKPKPSFYAFQEGARRLLGQ
jgi:hypothetical protein